MLQEAQRTSDRKLRLFAAALWRTRDAFLQGGKEALLVPGWAERIADGEQLSEVLPIDIWETKYTPLLPDASDAAIGMATSEVNKDYAASVLRDIIGNPFCGWMLESNFVAGCPIPTEKISIAWDAWLTHDVLSLARAAYEERGSKCERCNGSKRLTEVIPHTMYRWHTQTVDAGPCPRCSGTGRLDDGTLDSVRFNILADALTDAGCNDDEIPTHLRSLEPHYRGCWAVDLVLGKQ